MPRLLILLACSLVVAGCGQGTPRSAAPKSASAERTAFADAPAPLASLHRQANRLLGGGPAAFKARLRALRGYPVVVNKWASWCPPCRAEFPFFQRESLRHAGRVAFLGVDSNDSDDDARHFLRRLPLAYPSYRDPKLGIAAELHGVEAFPTTAFYDRAGRLAFVHLGAYATERKLAADMARYAR
jgi:cytochrome c biogenesis protein CcmG, thiol:disulfide interchange protein DsbE